jgi:dTDP-4-dehydrorhamnose 3,5-epimerase
MIFTPLSLTGAFLVNLKILEDERGFFARYFCKTEYALHGLETNWVQINNSMSKHKGTLRGLHFQRNPKAEVKVVRCISGAIWDVIVDIRKDSVTYGKWFGTELNEDNRTMMYVPRGFAHGFISLTDYAEIIYLVSEFYSAEHEGTLRWNDEFHGIRWPTEVNNISEKDKSVRDWEAQMAIII